MNLQLKAREMEVSQSVVLTNDYSNFDYAHLYAFTHLYVFTHLYDDFVQHTLDF